MMLVKADIQALAADIPLTVPVVLVSPDFDNPVVFSANFQPA